MWDSCIETQWLMTRKVELLCYPQCVFVEYLVEALIKQ